MRPSFFFTPSRIPVGARERRLIERFPAGLGASAHADVLMPFKAIVSRVISAPHHALDVLRHAAAQVCTAPGKCGDRGKSDDGKRGHVMRSDVTRTLMQIFLPSAPNFDGGLMGSGMPPVSVRPS